MRHHPWREIQTMRETYSRTFVLDVEMHDLELTRMLISSSVGPANGRSTLKRGVVLGGLLMRAFDWITYQCQVCKNTYLARPINPVCPHCIGYNKPGL
jgi:hypothetical protein